MRRERNRRKSVVRTKQIPTWLIVIAIIIIILSIIGLILRKNETKKEALLKEQERQVEISKIFEENEEEIKKIEHHIKSSKVRIKIVGNILCESSILQSAHNKENNNYDFIPIFSDIKDYITDSDITIGSLETNFYGEKYTSHNSPTSLINAISDLKINTLNIANNQNLSDGIEGLISTKTKLKDAGIETYGTKIADDDSNILIKEVKGIKIAFLSYITKIDEGIKLTEENEKYINIYSEEKVDKDIEYVKSEGAEYIVVNIHTGNTHYRLSKEEKEKINEKLVSSGADLIIGTHQNTLEKLEIKQNSEGKNVLIVNTLGNLISENSNLGMILEVQIVRSEETDGTVLSKVVYTPTYTIDNGKNSKNRYQVVDIRETVRKYENEDNTIVNKNIYNKLKNALNEIEKLIK